MYCRESISNKWSEDSELKMRAGTKRYRTCTSNGDWIDSQTQNTYTEVLRIDPNLSVIIADKLSVPTVSCQLCFFFKFLRFFQTGRYWDNKTAFTTSAIYHNLMLFWVSKRLGGNTGSSSFQGRANACVVQIQYLRARFVAGFHMTCRRLTDYGSKIRIIMSHTARCHVWRVKSGHNTRATKSWVVAVSFGNLRFKKIGLPWRVEKRHFHTYCQTDLLIVRMYPREWNNS